jgi:hypothetical protein
MMTHGRFEGRTANISRTEVNFGEFFSASVHFKCAEFDPTDSRLYSFELLARVVQFVNNYIKKCEGRMKKKERSTGLHRKSWAKGPHNLPREGTTHTPPPLTPTTISN